MAPPIPTTQELKDTIVNQITSSINQTIPLLPKAFIRVLAKALAAIFIILYKYSSFIFLQIFVATASFKETTVNGQKVIPLVEWGRLIGVGDPTPATKAELLIDITVINQTGSLPAGTQLVSTLNGITYLLKADVPLTAALVQGTIKAASDQARTGGAGAQGNLSPGDVVSFVQPQSDVAQDAVVDSQTVTGADGETEENYRNRVVERFSNRPQGGALLDYVFWGTEVSGILNVYPYTGDPGEVDVYAEAVATDTNPDGIPTPAQLDEVRQAIELDEDGLATRRPAGSFVNVFPITRVGFNVVVVGLTGDDLPQLQSDIDDALTDYFYDREPFIDGVTILPRKDQVTVNNISSIVDDYASAANGSFTDVTLQKVGDVITITGYILAQGEKAKLSSLTYA